MSSVGKQKFGFSLPMHLGRFPCVRGEIRRKDDTRIVLILSCFTYHWTTGHIEKSNYTVRRALATAVHCIKRLKCKE